MTTYRSSIILINTRSSIFCHHFRLSTDQMFQSIVSPYSPSSFALSHTLVRSIFPFPFIPSLSFLYKPKKIRTVSAHLRTKPEQWFAQIYKTPTAFNVAPRSLPEDGPIEVSPDTPSIFATTDDPTPLQTATSVLLTGAITVFLFRSIRRRVKRAKELKFRPSGAKKTLKDEAWDNLRALGSLSVEPGSPPSPAQAFLGAITAGVIAVILYKFTITIEAALNRQTISDNFSVRQITVTVRTIINGLCYLATFVFGINSLGLFLYSGQLAFNFLEGDKSLDTSTDEEKQPGLPSENAEVRSPSDDINKESD